jgi:hypothetical protein
VNYLGVINCEEMPTKYFNNIDKLMINDNLSDAILQKLANNDLYHTYLLCMIHQNRLFEIDFSNTDIQENVLKTMVTLNTRNAKTTIDIRSFILYNYFELNESYKSLFFGEYPLITLNELRVLKSFETAMSYIDFSNLVMEEQANMISEYINSIDLTQDEKINFLNLFTNMIIDEVIITKIFENLNFDRFNFKTCSTQYLENLISNISVALRLNEAEHALEFMRKMNLLLESLEQIVSSYGLHNGTVPIESYVQLINDIAIPTKQTLTILNHYEIAWGLTNNITKEMFDNGYIEQSIVGETLWNKEFRFYPETIDFTHYLKLYCDNSHIFNYMTNNCEFLSYIIENKKYNDFPSDISLSKLIPFYSCKQTMDFIKYLFVILDDNQKIEYLLSFQSLKTKEDSIAFSKFMLEEENHSFLKIESDFYKIREKLWEDAPTHKKQFTTVRNKLYPRKQLETALL